MPTILPPRMPKDETGVPSLGAAVDRLRLRHGSVIAFGVVSALLGLIALALVETATIASVLVIGFFMMVTGLFEIMVGLRTRTWGRLLLWEAAGLLYLVAGIAVVAAPETASVFITLMLGAGLLATGILRIVIGWRVSGGPRTGLVVAGAVTTLLGVLILLGWPGNSVLVLGTLLGIDLLFYGITWIMLGLRLRAMGR